MIAQRHGRIINLSSQLAQRTVGAGFAAYAATKGAVEAFTAELPLGRFGGVEDVAYCAVVLAADEAGYLTGQILHPSGGWVMG